MKISYAFAVLARVGLRALTIGSLLAAGVTVVATVQTQPALAATASEFDPGQIISDSNFYDANAMSQAEIQSFLESKVVCSNSNCLANYYEQTPQVKVWSWGTCQYYFGGYDSAAAIIYKVQKACGLSAKAILVTLQKEQGLITSSAPSSLTLRKAMGMGCPDTSVCDSEYYGFFNQVFAAARQLTWYGNSGGSYTYIRLGQWNNIRYSPDSSCGTKSVLVKNAATAALYYYTPYTPNQAALDNLYSVGDACSAYGNRNFWRTYSDWFGNPVVPPVYGDRYIAWQSAGGAAGILGNPTAVEICSARSSTSMWCEQPFQRGTIVWTPQYGAVPLIMGYSNYWKANGGARGILGYPVAPESCDSQIVCRQAFESGSVGYSPWSGMQPVYYNFDAEWLSKNANLGILGYPTGQKTCASSVCTQPFQRGTIVWSQRGGTASVLMGFNQYWRASGAAKGTLGVPIGNEVCTSNGCRQPFDNGSLSWAPGINVFPVLYNFDAKWVQNGAQNGLFGYATSDSVCTGRLDKLCYQKFQRASIVSSAAGTYAVIWRLNEAWQATQAEAGILGFPTSDETCYWNGPNQRCSQPFERGTIAFTSEAGAKSLIGAFSQKWLELGGFSGSLGYPMENEVCTLPNGELSCSQQFQFGRITWTAVTGAVVSIP